MDIVRFNYFNVERILTNNYKFYEPDCLNVYLRYKQINNSVTDLLFETPWIDYYSDKSFKESSDLKKIYISLLFKNGTHNLKILQFYNIINKIDNYVKFNNSFLNHFNDSTTKVFSEIDNTFIPSLKYYPNQPVIENSALRLKIFPKHIKVFNEKNKKIELSDIDYDCEIKEKLQCHSIWLSPDTYGITWIGKTLKVKPKPDPYKDILFS